MAKINVLQIFVPSLFIWIVNVKICSSQEQDEEPNQDNMTAGYDYDDSTADYTMFISLCEKYDVSHQFYLWFIPLSCAVIFILGLVGNSLVIFTFLYFRRLKTMTDVYLLNLAFADLLFTLALPFWAFKFLTKWVLGLAMCKALYTVHKVTLYSSILLLSCISVDRYFAITKAVLAHLHRTKTTHLSKLSSAAIWVVALMCSVPEMRNTGVHHNTCTPYPAVNSSISLRVSIQSTQIALGFVVPLLVMTFCYSAVALKLCQSRNVERKRALKVILAVVAAFFLCQVPYTLCLFVSTLDPARVDSGDCSRQKALLFATDVTQFLALYRCCLNPLVYGFIGVKFRQDLLKLMREMHCLTHEQFCKYGRHSGRKSSVADTETTTTFSP